MHTISISQQPTFDIEHIAFVHFEHSYIYFSSQEVFSFDCVYGMIVNRSRVLRHTKQESRLCELVGGAVIDAGFTGNLSWKIILTQEGVQFVSQALSHGHVGEIEHAFSACQQLYLHPHSINYYNGSNQTDLEPHIVFTR